MKPNRKETEKIHNVEKKEKEQIKQENRNRKKNAKKQENGNRKKNGWERMNGEREGERGVEGERRADLSG